MARFEDLLGKFRRDEMASAEVEEFLALLEADASPVAAPILEDLHNNAYPGQTDSAQRERMLTRILEQNRKHKRAVVLKIFRRAAAAAAVLILLATATWLYHSHPSTSSHPVQDILPGGNHATLTLSNGQKIILDSVRTGLIAQQGNSNVNKLTNGELAYSPLAPLHPEGDDRAQRRSRAELGKGGRGEMGAGGQSNTLSTPRGGFYELKLPDGTKVWLNATSSITYPTAFTGNTRQVSITGETYFEVARDPAKPFIVHAAGEEIQVLGTHFNINSYTDEPAEKTTLLEGLVKVNSANNQPVSIRPGEQASLNPSGKLSVITGVDLAGTMAWKDGTFRFRDATIEPIMRQIARWYDVDINYQGGGVKQHFIATIPMTATASEVFRALELTGGVHFKIEGRKITVMP